MRNDGQVCRAETRLNQEPRKTSQKKRHLSWDLKRGWDPSERRGYSGWNRHRERHVKGQGSKALCRECAAELTLWGDMILSDSRNIWVSHRQMDLTVFQPIPWSKWHSLCTGRKRGVQLMFSVSRWVDKDVDSTICQISIGFFSLPWAKSLPSLKK